MRKTGVFFLILAILAGLISGLSFASESAAPSGTAAGATSLTNDQYVLDFSKLQLADTLSYHKRPGGPGGPGRRRHRPGAGF
jgi:hypothetical protein